MKSGVNNKLLGQFRAKLDPKGRLFLPARLKKHLGTHIILTRGYEGSLLILSPDSWRKLTSDIQSKPLLFGPSRETARFILGNASEITLDSQGRFLLPKYLKEYGEIGNDLTFLGLGTYMELWSTPRWQAHQKALSAKIADLSTQVIDSQKQ